MSINFTVIEGTKVALEACQTVATQTLAVCKKTLAEALQQCQPQALAQFNAALSEYFQDGVNNGLHSIAQALTTCQDTSTQMIQTCQETAVQNLQTCLENAGTALEVCQETAAEALQSNPVVGPVIAGVTIGLGTAGLGYLAYRRFCSPLENPEENTDDENAENDENKNKPS